MVNRRRRGRVAPRNAGGTSRSAGRYTQPQTEPPSRRLPGRDAGATRIPTRSSSTCVTPPDTPRRRIDRGERPTYGRNLNRVSTAGERFTPRGGGAGRGADRGTGLHHPPARS